MLKQLLIVALVCGIAASVPTAQAAKKDKGEQFDAPKKEKKEKKPKKEKGDKEKPARAKPTEMSLVGTLSVGEEKKGKKPYSLATADGDVEIRGKKAAELEEWVGKRVTINCTGRLVESKKGKALVIAKLGDVTETAE